MGRRFGRSAAAVGSLLTGAGAGGRAVSAEERAVIDLCAALATGGEGGVRGALERARDLAPAELVEEALLQSVLFLGYPAALNGFAVWRDVGVAPRPAAAPADPALWRLRGERVCRIVYGEQFERLRDNVRALHPDLEAWMITEGYGKVLGRPGMSLELRELCIVAQLACVEAPRQLYSHLRGALNAGSTARRIDATLQIALERAPGRRDQVLGVWAAVRQRMTTR